MIDNFVPPDEVERVEARAQWDGEKEVWVLPRLELAGNSRRVRPVSDPRAIIPESETTRRRAAYDPNPRFKVENVVALEPDVPERTTVEYAHALMARDGGVGMGMGAGGMDPGPEDGDGGERARAPRKDRPRTATRKKKDEDGSSGGGGGGGTSAAYPVARGLVARS